MAVWSKIFKVGEVLVEESHSICCDCCGFTIGLAAEKLGAAFVYELYVHPSAFHERKCMLQQMGAATAGNPLAPYVNLHEDSNLPIYGWYLRHHGQDHAVGSRGAT